MRGYLSLIWKDSVTHKYDILAYVHVALSLKILTIFLYIFDFLLHSLIFVIITSFHFYHISFFVLKQREGFLLLESSRHVVRTGLTFLMQFIYMVISKSHLAFLIVILLTVIG